MIQIARGIARAHDLGVVHRDLKPDNIFIVTRDDGRDLVKILDFGIARSRADTRLTNAGELFGTPQYMAPERITSGEAGPSVDLYALGIIFFEMATGQLPFNANDPATFLIRHMKDPAPAPRSVDPRVPEQLDALVLQLLEKDPRARPVDAHRVEHDLVELSRTLRIPIPPEPEADPSSSRPPAKTLPAPAIDQWAQRIELFEQMASRAYGPNVPPAQARTLGELKRLVLEINEVRTASAKEQRALEGVDAYGRDARQRLGFAVDALGLDASKARDELRAARTGAPKSPRRRHGGPRKRTSIPSASSSRGRAAPRSSSRTSSSPTRTARPPRRSTSGSSNESASATRRRRSKARSEASATSSTRSPSFGPPSPSTKRASTAIVTPRKSAAVELSARLEGTRRAAAPPAGDGVLRAAENPARARSPFSASRVVTSLSVSHGGRVHSACMRAKSVSFVASVGGRVVPMFLSIMAASACGSDPPAAYPQHLDIPVAPVSQPPQAKTSAAPAPPPPPVATAPDPSRPQAVALTVTPEAAEIVAATDRADADRQLDAGRHPGNASCSRSSALTPGDARRGARRGNGVHDRAPGPRGRTQGKDLGREPARLLEVRGSALQRAPRQAGDEERGPGRPRDRFALPARGEETLDAVVCVLNYHDTVWLGVDRAKMNKAVFDALKKGRRVRGRRPQRRRRARPRRREDPPSHRGVSRS